MTTTTPAPAPMTARLRELMEKATPGPICESALVPLYAVQDYGYNEAVAAFAEFDDEGELTMQFQGDKAKANLALYTFLVNHAPTILRLLEAVEGAEKALEFYESAWVWDADDPGVGGRVPGETCQAWQEPSGDLIADLGHRAKAALATLRAAREGAR